MAHYQWTLTNNTIGDTHGSCSDSIVKGSGGGVLCVMNAKYGGHCLNRYNFVAPNQLNTVGLTFVFQSNTAKNTHIHTHTHT